MMRSLVVMLAITSFTARGQDTTAFKPALHFNGYVKGMPSVSWSPLLNTTAVSGLLHNRLNFHADLLRGLRAGVEFRDRVFVGDQVRDDPTLAHGLEMDPGLVDMSWVWLKEDAFVGHTIIDRAWLEYERGHFVARAGRQRINWGLDLVWNPNDIFNAFNYLDFDYEERPGSDAISLRYFTGVSGQVELAVKADSSDQRVAAGMYRFHVGSYDLQVIGGQYREDAAVGAGWAGNLGGSGLKGETTVFIPTDQDTTDATSISFTSTVDHSFRNGLYLIVSGLYNSNGAATPAEVSGGDVIARQVSPKNLMPFRSTGMVSVTYAFNPIISGSLAVLGSPGPNALILFPSLSVSLANNWQLDVFYQGYWQEVPTLGFRGIGDAAYARVKWSF
ncbi:MAG: hypothetical protein KDB97_03555 [Flavobacteriales bacterium]|nr:hypothetical protein [Flavobacteriales bacterium]